MPDPVIGASGPRRAADAGLSNLFNPRHIAVFGASPQRGNNRNNLVRAIQKHGFPGAVYPVNPSHPEIEGLTAYASVEALPEVPDLALIITPAETVPEIIARCGQHGIRAAIVYSAGFEEVETGQDVARRLKEAAIANDVLVLGPNCQGIRSARSRAVFSFSGSALTMDVSSVAPIAVISQSGALASAIGNELQKRRVGSSYIVSVGNETCLDAVDVLGWMIEQDDVRVVALYLEGLNDASRMLAMAGRARQRGVQIVALKAGRTKVGQLATASHTGKIASSHAVYVDLMTQAGIILVDGIADLLAAVEVLAFLPDPRMSGDPKGGIAVLSVSGGAGALLADHCEEQGLAMAEFSPDTAEALERILPDLARKANPVDLTGQLYGVPNLFPNACDTIGADPRTEALVIQFASSGARNAQDNGEAFKRAAQRFGIPIILGFVGATLDPAERASFREAGILASDDTADVMRALSWLYRRQRAACAPARAIRAPLAPRPAPRSWPEIMNFCAEAFITPAKWTLVRPGERASVACAGLTYPLVVKVLPADCPHKTELGLVRLRVASTSEVDALAAEFRQRLERPDLTVLVQEMVQGGVEIVLSCLRGSDFGPILSIGGGGVGIELYRDVVHLALPTTPEQVLAALRTLKAWTLLQGYRGQKSADVAALGRAAARFGDLFLATPEATEFEINPLLALPEGKGVVAVDALVANSAG